MKNILKSTILFLNILFCSACDFERNILENESIIELTALEKTLSCQAPNGCKISTTIKTLKEEISVCLKEIYGIEEFELTQIEYKSNNSDGYVAFIYYLTNDGIVGNIVKSNMQLALNGKKIIQTLRIRTKTSQEMGDGEYMYYCIQRLGKVCDVGCGIQTSITNLKEMQCTCVNECDIVQKISR